jgi:hypothetical protein
MKSLIITLLVGYAAANPIWNDEVDFSFLQKRQGGAAKGSGGSGGGLAALVGGMVNSKSSLVDFNSLSVFYMLTTSALYSWWCRKGCRPRWRGTSPNQHGFSCYQHRWCKNCEDAIWPVHGSQYVEEEYSWRGRQLVELSGQTGREAV